MDEELSDRDAKTLNDFLGFADQAARLVGRGQTEFSSDEMLRLAAEAILHRCGETASRLSDQAKASTPGVDWRAMKLMRNVVAHKYDQINHRLVWAALSDVLPRDAQHIRQFLEE